MVDFERFLISEDMRIIDAMRLMDELLGATLFLQKDGRLLASLADADIRRYLFANKNIHDAVSKAANYKPRYVEYGNEKSVSSNKYYRKLGSIPVIKNDLIVDIIIADELLLEAFAVKYGELKIPVVIMAGGKGTRLYPYTKILPKPLIPIGELPIAEHVINQFKKYGCNKYYMILNHKKNMIKAYFNEIEKDYELIYAEEEKPLGTGGGLGLLKGQITETFFLTNCDILIQADLTNAYRFHCENNNVITMICSLKNFQIPYGVVDVDKNGKIIEMNEKPNIAFFMNAGCYIVEPRVIDNLNDGEFVDFPEIVNYYRDKGENVSVFPIAENAWLDMGQFDGLEKMQSALEKYNG